MVGNAAVGLDSVLSYLGNAHPCVTVQLLVTLGLGVLGVGSPEVFTLLPIPLYSCWHALTPRDLANTCEGKGLLPVTPSDDEREVIICADPHWKPQFFPGAVLAGIRVVVVLVAGLCMDALGRRRSIVAWMGLYFVVAFSRTFAPNPEALVLCVTLEGASAQAATIGLVLLASEGSTQGECVRSVCLVLLGHAVGVAAGAPLIHSFVEGAVYQQMARSLPSLVFVLFIISLPGSARWAVCRGRVHEATLTLKRSHHMTFDPTMRYKLTTLYQEHKASLVQYKCHGHPLKESVVPLVRSCRLALSTLIFLVCGLAYGCACGARHLFDPVPYQSLEDRQLAFGIFELIVLLLLGLTVTRLAVKRVLVALFTLLSLAIPLTHTVHKFGWDSCGGLVFLSGFSHGCLVAAGVWLTLGAVRLTPTHSRGLVLGGVYAMATLGQILPYFDIMSGFARISLYLDPYAEVGIWAIVTFVSALLTLLLPPTPSSLPDTLTHLYPSTVSDEKPETELESESTHL